MGLGIGLIVCFCLFVGFCLSVDKTWVVLWLCCTVLWIVRAYGMVQGGVCCRNFILLLFVLLVPRCCCLPLWLSFLFCCLLVWQCWLFWLVGVGFVVWWLVVLAGCLLLLLV